MKTTVDKLKKQIAEMQRITIDFRSDVFAPNPYGASPVMSYNKADNIVQGLFVALDLDCRYNNAGMIMDRLKIESLKSVFEDYVSLANKGLL